MRSEIELSILAAKLRKTLGEDGESPVDIFALAQQIEKLTLVCYPMGKNISGICIKGSQSNVIAINSAMTVGRQRFSLAHELYHLYFDSNMKAICAKKIGDGSDIEKEADIFASYFLMPSLGLRTKAELLQTKSGQKTLSDVDVVRIENWFQISHQATVIRLKREGLLESQAAEEMMTKPVLRLAETCGYSGDLYRPTNPSKQYTTLGHYISQAQKVLELELVSEGKYEELLMDAFRADLVYGSVEEGGDVLD